MNNTLKNTITPTLTLFSMRLDSQIYAGDDDAPLGSCPAILPSPSSLPPPGSWKFKVGSFLFLLLLLLLFVLFCFAGALSLIKLREQKAARGIKEKHTLRAERHERSARVLCYILMMDRTGRVSVRTGSFKKLLCDRLRGKKKKKQQL